MGLHELTPEVIPPSKYYWVYEDERGCNACPNRYEGVEITEHHACAKAFFKINDPDFHVYYCECSSTTLCDPDQGEVVHYFVPPSEVDYICDECLAGAHPKLPEGDLL